MEKVHCLKRFVFLVMALGLVTTFTSCDDDDEPKPNVPALTDVVGNYAGKMQTTSVSPLAEEGEEPQGTDVSAEVTNENVSFEKFPVADLITAIMGEAAPGIIEAVGDDPDREGLRETPKRFADMMAEQFAYTAVSNEDIAREFEKTFATPENDMVVVKDIPIFSHCEHHIALMYNMKAAVGYIPHGRVIGLSKIARIADAVSKRFQIQERIGTDIRDVMEMVTDSPDVIVYIEGEHSCMTARGIKKPGTRTRTIASSGAFKTDSALRGEFMKLALEKE
jgi:GTP cyclohydrolase I